MKKIVIMSLAVMMASVVKAEGTVNVVENMQPFNKVSVNVPSRVRIIKGESYGVSVYSADKAQESALQVAVKDGILHIDTNDQDVRSSSGKGTVITVVTPADDIDFSAGNGLQSNDRKAKSGK